MTAGPFEGRAEPVVLTRTHGVSVTVVPGYGARIAQITDSHGNDWLANTGAQELADDVPVSFAAGTRGGWDECLPSVAPCGDPNRPGCDIADHGDFWAAPWSATMLDDHAATFITAVPGHPLAMRKTVRLPAGRQRFTVDIDIVNRSDAPYQFLYSAHPLWAFNSDVVVDVPGSGDFVAGFGCPDDLTAPIGEIVRRGDRTNYKVFVRWSGTARYAVPALSTAVVLRQDPAVNRWLGVCVNRGGYPAGMAGDYWIALEPTTAPTDSLATAAQAGSAAVLKPRESVRFRTSVEFLHHESVTR